MKSTTKQSKKSSKKATVAEAVKAVEDMKKQAEAASLQPRAGSADQLGCVMLGEEHLASLGDSRGFDCYSTPSSTGLAQRQEWVTSESLLSSFSCTRCGHSSRCGGHGRKSEEPSSQMARERKGTVA